MLSTGRSLSGWSRGREMFETAREGSELMLATKGERLTGEWVSTDALLGAVQVYVLSRNPI